ncbi:MAG TPA: hypothetical protein VGN53_08415 [Klebsiella sp.]|jgi:hypothetical protein
MWRLLLVFIFCLSALYGLKVSKPVVIKNTEEKIISVENLALRNNTCLSKTETLLVKNIHFHPDGGHIYLITFMDKDENIFSISTNFHKLNDSDISHLNNLLDVNQYYAVKYYDCQKEVKRYNLDVIYFYLP